MLLAGLIAAAPSATSTAYLRIATFYRIACRSARKCSTNFQWHVQTAGFAAPLPIQGSPYRSHAAYVGTPDYASLSALGQRQQGCADDCEALAYTLLEMWQGESSEHIEI